MKKNWGLNGALALFLLAFGIFAYWLEYDYKPKKDSKEEETRKVFQLKDKSVTSIKISTGDSDRAFTLQCKEEKGCRPGEQSQWVLSAPVELQGDKTNINSLLSTLNNTTVTDTIDLKDKSPEDQKRLLQEFGLNTDARANPKTPRIEVKVGSESQELFLGSVHPIGDKYFALTAKNGAANEAQVFLVPNFFKSNIDHNLTYWRDKKLMEIKTADITGFELSSPKGKVKGTRKDGEWDLGGVKGDIENVDSFLNTVAFLNAKEFLTPKDLAGARSNIQVSLKGPTPITLKIFEKPGKTKIAPASIFAQVQGRDTVFELQPSSKERLEKGLKDLRVSKLITSLERFSLKRAEFVGGPFGKTPFVIFNQNANWVDLSDAAHKLDTEKVTQFFDRIAGNKITDFLEGKSIPSGEASGVTVTLGEEKTDTKRKILFWRNGEFIYARDLLSSRKSVEAYKVDSLIKDAIPKGRDAFDPAKSDDKSAPPADPKADS